MKRENLIKTYNKLGFRDKEIFEDISEITVNLWNNGEVGVSLFLSKNDKNNIPYLRISVKHRKNFFEHKEKEDGLKGCWIKNIIEALESGDYKIKSKISLGAIEKYLVIAKDETVSLKLSKI